MRPIYYKPDYRKYTLKELYDVLENVDRERYTDRYLEVKSILENQEKLAALKEEQVKIDERQEILEAEENAFCSAIIPIIYGIIILFFGVGFSRADGFFEIESPLTRFFFGSIMCIVGIVGIKRLILGNTNKPLRTKRDQSH